VGLPTRLSHVHGLPFPILFSKTAHTPITAFTDAPPVSNQDRIRTSPAGEAGKDSATEVQETEKSDSLHQTEEIPEKMESARNAWTTAIGRRNAASKHRTKHKKISLYKNMAKVPFSFNSTRHNRLD
jgi:hypothetical protein